MGEDAKPPQPDTSAVQLPQAEGLNALRRRIAILEAIAWGSEHLIKTAQLDQRVREFLAQLGQAAEVDRVYVFANAVDTEGRLIASQQYRWVLPTSESLANQPRVWDSLLLSAGLQRWISALEGNQPLYGQTQEFSADERQLLHDQNIQSILIVPIWVQGKWWGLIGFDCIHRKREWMPPEIETLKTAARIIGTALENSQLQQTTQDWAGHLAALHDVNRTVGSTLDQDQVLRLTLDRVCELFRASRAVVYLADFLADSAIQHAAVGIPRAKLTSTAPLPLKTSLTGQVIITGRPFFIEKDLSTRSFLVEDSYLGQISVDVEAELPFGAGDGLEDTTRTEAAALVPMAVGEHVLGTLNLAFDRSRPFDSDERRLLIAIGRQAGIALANARLFQEVTAAEREARRRAEHLAALNEIGQAINSSLKPAAVYSCIVEQAAALLDCQAANLFLLDENVNEVVCVASYVTSHEDHRFQDITGQHFSADKSPVMSEMRDTRAPVALADIDSKTPAYPELLRQPGVRAFLALPLISRDQITGFLYLIDQTGTREWRRDEITVANQLASQSAIAIENARLFDMEHRTRQTAEALQETAHIVNTSLDLDQALSLLLKQLAKLVPYDSAAVFLHSDRHLRVASATGFPDQRAVTQLTVNPTDNALMRQTIETRRPLVLADAQNDERFQNWGGTDYIRGWIGVPLFAGDELVGVLTIDSREPNAYDEESARLAQALADQTAVAIHKARLLDNLRRANRELRRLDELKGQFIQNVAHELRTPLTLVRGYVELLAQGTLDLDTQHEALHSALSHTETLVQLVEGITTLQDLNLGELMVQRIDPTDLAKTALQLASQKAVRARINLQTHCSPGLPALTGDFIWLSQALYQLLDNAIKFSPGGGSVDLDFHLDPEGSAIQIKVEDQGIGVPPGEHERIFDLFYQADGSTTRRFGGTGLGLAIVQRVVNAHGGRIWVESPIEHNGEGTKIGSRFTIELPLKAV